MKILITLLASLILLSSSGKDKPDPRKKEVKIKMSDGTELATDIFLPRGNGKYPVVLLRTPYGKWQDAWMGKAFGFFGIAVVLQDVRGKNGSGGEFYPFINERSDGLQTLRWIRQQPWSDGNITGWGGSYVGYTQWAISDSLDFLTPMLTGANIYDFVYPDSLFSLHSAYSCGVLNASSKTNTISPEKLKSGPMTLPVSAALWLQSDEVSTDFIVGLQDVFPDGKIINIQEGGAGVRFSSPQPLKTEISVWATGYQLNPGHKLRVFISSAWFPRYNRNLNNGESAATAVKIVTAEQKLYYGGDTPSSINLPIFED